MKPEYGTHALDTPEKEREAIADFLAGAGLSEPKKNQVEAALAHIHAGGNDPYLAALRAK
jgi:hypothetical protein